MPSGYFLAGRKDLKFEIQTPAFQKWWCCGFREWTPLYARQTCPGAQAPENDKNRAIVKHGRPLHLDIVLT